MSDKIYYKTIRSHEEELEDLYNAFIDQAINQYGSGDELSRHLVGDNNREDQGRQFLANKMHRYRKAKSNDRPFLDLLSEICKKIAELE
ncbi:hypothetical protein [Leptospira andrefontaineae]|uniref:Uncharacterized protein n=1 Tax=Leptospira andrefontaineae TaxID=2484976 RepID=A0A4V6QL13_9LEPT|nr:hypothetical protein [Leptospira andrefontaineae]TGK41282.1 hypothetical protein EHO65_07600 [Leptospira andrefontaineae]